MEKLLDKLLNELYNEKGNILIFSKQLIEMLGYKEEEINLLISTPSLNKNYLEWKGNISFRLLPQGRYYIEEKRKKWYKKIIPHINRLSGFYTVFFAFLAIIISSISLYISLIKIINT